MGNRYFVLILVIIALSFSSCDYIRHPYTVPGPNGCTSPQPTFTQRTNPVRKVLLEDFTGHYCGNCPQAHSVIDDLLSNPTYANSVVAIAHHSSNAGVFTEPWSTDIAINPNLEFIYDFRNPISSEIDYKYNMSAYPSGMINRRSFGSSKLVGHTTWQSHISELLLIPQEMDIQLINYYDPAGQTICSYYYTQALMDLNGDFKILLFLTEDSIIQWQKNSTVVPNYVPNYVHKHVMRTSFNGVFGTPINDGGVIHNGETSINGFSVSTSNTDWNLNHLKVVAIVYNTSTEEVVQVEEVSVIP